MSALVEQQIKPYQQTDRFSLFCGDCREVLATLSDCSVDSVVCDPPYHLTQVSRAGSPRHNDPETPYGRTRIGERGFMGKTWDGGDVAHDPVVWFECLRVLKPGSHLLAFGGSRTYHRMACAIEDAGFEIRDQIMWLYGSGFPKSHNLEAPWDGWGTALKPAHEPIVVARKSIRGTVEENVLRYGTGALNIDDCRVPTDDKLSGSGTPPLSYAGTNPRPYHTNAVPIGCFQHENGRWPANVIHDGSEEVLAVFPEAPGQSGAVSGKEPSSKTNN